MAYDADNHEHDPVTGFLRHRQTGHLVGIEQAPAPVADVPTDYPKWVEPHVSHIARQGEHIAVPGHEWHIERGTNKVTVLVGDDEAERFVTTEKPARRDDDVEHPVDGPAPDHVTGERDIIDVASPVPTGGYSPFGATHDVYVPGEPVRPAVAVSGRPDHEIAALDAAGPEAATDVANVPGETGSQQAFHGDSVAPAGERQSDAEHHHDAEHDSHDHDED